MITFLLNDQRIETDLPLGTVLLDFVREYKHLKGTKIGCREGDCGACTVLVGELQHGQIRYRSMTSCLMPLANAHGKHIVTIEGLNLPDTLTPMQAAMAEEGGTQCGFCTVGFVVSLAGFCLSDGPYTYERGIAAIDGNICRCTGYKSIERAINRIVSNEGLAIDMQREWALKINWLVENNYLPSYFLGVFEKLEAIHKTLLLVETNHNIQSLSNHQNFIVGGGTDLFVQKPEILREAAITPHFDQNTLRYIEQRGSQCYIGASVTASDLLESPLMLQLIPQLPRFMKWVSSTPIRNMGTLGGNLVNASPIGDLTIFFLALNSYLTVGDGINRREVALKDFYLGYKTLDLHKNEIVESLHFEMPVAETLFNFEKVCKRTHLDIASVNSAMQLTVVDNQIVQAHVSAGGVGPVPLYLRKTSEFLRNQPLNEATLQVAQRLADTEISPISDARGSAAYKRLLLRQLLQAHIEAFETVVGNDK